MVKRHCNALCFGVVESSEVGLGLLVDRTDGKYLISRKLIIEVSSFIQIMITISLMLACIILSKARQEVYPYPDSLIIWALGIQFIRELIKLFILIIMMFTHIDKFPKSVAHYFMLGLLIFVWPFSFYLSLLIVKRNAPFSSDVYLYAGNIYTQMQFALIIIGIHIILSGSGVLIRNFSETEQYVRMKRWMIILHLPFIAAMSYLFIESKWIIGFIISHVMCLVIRIPDKSRFFITVIYVLFLVLSIVFLSLMNWEFLVSLILSYNDYLILSISISDHLCPRL